MKRTELEIKITEALDEHLSPQEIEALELALQEYPDLKQDWELLMQPVDLKAAFPEEVVSAETINELKQKVHHPFLANAHKWVVPYLMAAGIATLALIGLSGTFKTDEIPNNDHLFEWIYAADSEQIFEEFDEMVFQDFRINGDQ